MRDSQFGVICIVLLVLLAIWVFAEILNDPAREEGRPPLSMVSVREKPY